MYLNRASQVGIKDLSTQGYNPLRCDICQEKHKLENKNTCGNKECQHRYFEQKVIPDLDETRIIKTKTTSTNTRKIPTRHTFVLDSEMASSLQFIVGKIMMQTGRGISVSGVVRFCIQHALDTGFEIEKILEHNKKSSDGGNNQ